MTHSAKNINIVGEIEGIESLAETIRKSLIQEEKETAGFKDHYGTLLVSILVHCKNIKLGLGNETNG